MAGHGTTAVSPGSVKAAEVPAGTGDEAYLKALREIVVPAAQAFRPELILVSAGFDAHWHDLALNVSCEGFAAMAGILQSLADELCNGRLVCVLEAGYHTESLANGVHAVLAVMAGKTPLVKSPAEAGLFIRPK